MAPKHRGSMSKARAIPIDSHPSGGISAAESHSLRLLRHFDLAGRALLEKPPSHALRRYAAIPLLLADRSKSRKIQGHVEFDSWSNKPAFSLRDVAVGIVRRLTLVAGPVSLEIVAERQQDNWSFAARACKDNQVSYEFVLNAASRKLLPQSQSFYQWTSTHAPRKFRLLSPEFHIDFEAVSWL